MGSTGATIVLPVFAIMIGGYLCARWKILPAGSSEVLSRFVFFVSMPALIVGKLSAVPVGEFFNWPYLGVLGGGMLGVFCIGLLAARFLFRATLGDYALHGLSAMFSSTAYIGLPLVLTIFGDAALVPGLIGAVITGAVFAPLAILLAEIDRGKSGLGDLGRPLLSALTKPPILATAAGLAISASGFALPAPALSFFDMLGGAFIPCALFAAGFFIAGCDLRGARLEVGWLVIVKLALHPLITWWLAYRVFELEGILPAVAVIQAALPTGVPVFVIAQQYRCFVLRASAAIALSTAISVITLPLLLIFIVT